MPTAHASNTTTAGEAAMPMSAKAKVGRKGGMPKFVPMEDELSIAFSTATSSIGSTSGPPDFMDGNADGTWIHPS